MRRTDIHTILIIGSGPIVIGQGCEFDYSGTQACKSLREEGYRVVLVNSNPATIMTDPAFSDRTYIEPITPEAVRKIIIKERELGTPIDALLPTLGGQTALNCACALHDDGTLREFGIEMIGASREAISRAEDREAFRQVVESCGLRQARAKTVTSLEEANAFVAEIGLPAIIRAAFTLGGTGSGIAYNKTEFEEIVRKGLDASMIGQVQIDESALGWKEYELEVIRDRKDNCIVVCGIENIDAMGVHTGDSITVAPIMTLSDKEYQRMRDASFDILRAVGVETGGANVQFAVNPVSGEMFVVEMNPRVSRSSALASKATGFPIAKIAAKLAVGYTLDELRNDITGTTSACFEPSIDYVVVKMPRWTFEKFPEADETLTTQMKSVGEAMSIGRTFKESLQKAIRSMEVKRFGLGLDRNDKWLAAKRAVEAGGLRFTGELTTEIPHGLVAADGSPIEWPIAEDTLYRKLTVPSQGRLYYVRYAFKMGWSIAKVHDLTKIDPWFLDQIKQLCEFEDVLCRHRTLEELPRETLFEAKRLGYSDPQLANLYLGDITVANIMKVRAHRKGLGIEPVYELVDTCAAEFEAATPYYYSTYETPFSQGTPALRAGSANAYEQQVLQWLGDDIDLTLAPEINAADFEARNPFPKGDSSPSELEQHWRNLPHVRLPGATYFVTWNCVPGEILSSEERRLALDALTHWNGVRCRVFGAVVMPDHVHWILKPFEGFPLDELVEGVKRFSARQINERRGSKGSIWNPECFDHIVRDIRWLAKFLFYVIRNPVEAKLASAPSAYESLFVDSSVKMVEEVGSIVAPETTGSESRGTKASCDDEIRVTPREKIIILGGGPNRIGQGIEFDYCCVQAAFAARDMGFESVMINSNPETVSTDYDTSDLLFFEPLTLEDTLNVIERLNGGGVDNPNRSGGVVGVIVQFGGQTPLNLAAGLTKAGVPLIGTGLKSIDLAEDRDQFKALLNELGFLQPASGIAYSLDQAVAIASDIGYPVLVRPSYVLGGRGMETCFDEESLRRYMRTAVDVSELASAPVLVDKFLSEAIEVDVDVVADFEPHSDTASRQINNRSERPRAIIAGVMQHIEEAGIHSGDSCCVLPPFSLPKSIVERIQRQARTLAEKLNVRGLMNVQMAVKDEQVYILEVNPRASRTVPFVAKANGVPWATIAAKTMMGASLEQLQAREVADTGFYAVKQPVFPFDRFPGVDVVLGPEMRSTGEVMGAHRSPAVALAKALMGANIRLPTKGNVFMSVRDSDKPHAIEIARLLVSMGFTVLTTAGTQELLRQHAIDTVLLRKVSEGARPNILDKIANGEIHLIINTPTRKGANTDEGRIRATAVRSRVPMITTITGARAAVQAIAALRAGTWTVSAIQDYFPKLTRSAIKSIEDKPSVVVERKAVAGTV